MGNNLCERGCIWGEQTETGTKPDGKIGEVKVAETCLRCGAERPKDQWRNSQLTSKPGAIAT
jgi:hypothetical protein